MVCSGGASLALGEVGGPPNCRNLSQRGYGKHMKAFPFFSLLGFTLYKPP